LRKEGENVSFLGVPKTAGEGARKVREAIESKGVRFFQGAVSSSVGLAIGQVAAEKQSIYVTSVGADEITGKNCNRFMFRWSVATYGAVQETLVPLIKKFPQAKKWYTIEVLAKVKNHPSTSSG
jgi:branched-chain amino acid transport system substrate-binding protein